MEVMFQPGHVSATKESAEHSRLFLSNQDVKKGTVVAKKVTVTPLEQKSIEDEPSVYASKPKATDAFKALLESVNVESN